MARTMARIGERATLQVYAWSGEERATTAPRYVRATLTCVPCDKQGATSNLSKHMGKHNVT